MLLKLSVLLAFLCINCRGLCGDSLLDPGETCDDGNLSNEDGCSSSCLIEYNYKCLQNSENRTVCYIDKPFSAFLQYIALTNPYELNLSFNKPLNFSASFLANRTNLSISGLNSSQFSWEMSENAQLFRVKLVFQVSFLSQFATLSFNNSDEGIKDVFAETLGVGSLSVSARIPLFIIYSEIAENFMVFMKYFIQFVFVTMLFCFVPLSILNSLTVFWSFLGNLC